MGPKTPPPEAPATSKAAIEEPRNVVVTVIENRTVIRKAICAAGRLDFLLTATEAKQLADLGKVRIEGLFTEA